LTSLRDPDATNRKDMRARAGYQPPAWDERMRGNSGHHGVGRFLIFLVVMATLVLVGLFTIGRPVLASAVVGWASDNPSALNLPFVGDLVAENLGDKLTSAPSTDSRNVGFVVQDGDTTQTIAQRLQDQGLVEDQRAFVYLAYKNKVAGTWTAGQYELRANMTPQDVLTALQAGPPPNPTVVIALREGLRLEQITALLEKLHSEQGLVMDPMDFYNFVKSPPAEFLAQYPWLHLPKGASLEGFLGPATYTVKPDITAEQFATLLVNKFQQLAGDRINVPKSRGMSFYQIVTLASIVEQEVVYDNDRAPVAGVYQNRLNKGMSLGSNPTVIYANDTMQLRALPFDQWVQFSFWNLPKAASMTAVQLDADLEGYQTYINVGLIPGPICTPTMASIDAALNPDTKDGYYYFVTMRDANGNSTGHLAFAKTHAQHLANLKKYGYTP
jgi:UPF0755 protein